MERPIREECDQLRQRDSAMWAVCNSRPYCIGIASANHECLQCLHVCDRFWRKERGGVRGWIILGLGLWNLGHLTSPTSLPPSLSPPYVRISYNTICTREPHSSYQWTSDWEKNTSHTKQHCLSRYAGLLNNHVNVSPRPLASAQSWPDHAVAIRRQMQLGPLSSPSGLTKQLQRQMLTIDESETSVRQKLCFKEGLCTYRYKYRCLRFRFKSF